MKQNIGEFLDRTSILLHKCQKIGELSYPEFIRYVEELLLELPEENFPEMIRIFRKLYEINGKMWKLEFDIRMGKEKVLGLEEIGERALQIRHLNNERIETQNEIIKKFGGYTNPNVGYWKKEKSKLNKNVKRARTSSRRISG